MKSKCKKNLYDRHGLLIFTKDIWYEQDIGPMDYGNITYRSFISELYNGPPWFIIDNDEFKEHFYSIDEHRESEIDKIIDQ